MVSSCSFATWLCLLLSSSTLLSLSAGWSMVEAKTSNSAVRTASMRERRRTQQQQQPQNERRVPPYYSQDVSSLITPREKGKGKTSHSKSDYYYYNPHEDEMDFYYNPEEDEDSPNSSSNDGTESETGTNQTDNAEDPTNATGEEADAAFDGEFSSPLPSNGSSNSSTGTTVPVSEPSSSAMTEPPATGTDTEIDGETPSTDEPVAGRDDSTDESPAGPPPFFDTSENDDGTIADDDTIQDGGGNQTTPGTVFNGETSLTTDLCPGVPADKVTEVTWIYAVEFRPAVPQETMNAVINVLELQLVSELNFCGDTSRKNMIRRRLLMEGVAGLDYMPRDTQRMDEECLSNDNETISGVCNTYDGRMSLYLEQSANEEAVINEIRFNIQSVMQRTDFAVLPEVVRVWYVGPEISAVSEINRGSGDDDQPPAGSQEFNSAISTGGVVAFAALGLFVFGALMLGVFRVRGRNAAVDGTLTIEPDSTITKNAGDPPTPSSKVSPFSAMLPKAYNLHDPETMSAILEGDSDSDSRADVGSIIVSEGGFTTDGEESTIDGSVYTSKVKPVLGAHKTDEDDAPNDSVLLFEDDNELASIDKA
ncbi:hypothetical protein IV203_037150 [Nitzschia inconspicua]|uniref:SEA domain-containing protein n=1 Tax=Nitzschia inconspicua TaxID=303405 RepID=A0A9K3LLL5_9STRA|nr:hypothetical protein IV203_037150 [Nitzschia inconspicua]